MDKNILQDFYLLTKRDIKIFFQEALDFFQGDAIIITDYFSGLSKVISSTPFERFEKLEKERNSYFETIHQYSTRMSNTKWFDIIEALEGIDSRLQTLRNINRWSRSSILNTSYSSGVQINYTLGQNQTLESVSKEILLSSNPQDDWSTIALSNRLSEEDYSLEGGNNLQLELSREVNLGIQVNSVVDVLVGKSIYGKDLDRSLTIENEDYKVLGYDETIKQSIEILINLKKKDNPDYPTYGLQSTIAVGKTRSLLNFPIISRQLSQTFSTDDTLKDFTINSYRVDQDNILVDYNISTRLDETIPTNEAIL